MEESTSWKNHTLTLLIFGGIVALSAIFFVLGMLVGRTQGQQIAKQAFAEKAASAPAAEANDDDFKLNFYAETTEDKPDLKLEPPPPPAAPPKPKESTPSTSAPRKESKTSRNAVASPVVAKAKVPEVFLQILATKDEKKALNELKKVQSKGFKARIVEGVADNAKLHRVWVGPYKESQVKLATSDLHAKGFKEVIRK